MKLCVRVWRTWRSALERKETAVRCPMEAREGAELVLAYCSRRLDPDKSAWFERHLAACVSCQEMWRRRSRSGKRSIIWDALPIPRDFDRRLKWRIEAEERKPWPQRLTGLRPECVAASGDPGCLDGRFGLGRFPGSVPPTRPTPISRRRSETTEVEQAERALEDLEMIRQFTLPPREANAAEPDLDAPAIAHHRAMDPGSRDWPGRRLSLSPIRTPTRSNWRLVRMPFRWWNASSA